jgi:hypothetical protein
MAASGRKQSDSNKKKAFYRAALPDLFSDNPFYFLGILQRLTGNMSESTGIYQHLRFLLSGSAYCRGFLPSLHRNDSSTAISPPQHFQISLGHLHFAVRRLILHTIFGGVYVGCNQLPRTFDRDRDVGTVTHIQIRTFFQRPP